MELEKDSELNDNNHLNVGIKGLGGWLILVGLGYFVGIIRCSILVKQILDLYSDGSMGILSNPQNDNYDSLLYLLINFELIANIVFIIALVGALFFFFLKKKIFPKYAIMFIVVTNLFALLDMFMGKGIGLEVLSTERSKLIGGLIGVVIWISYFIKSERVKNTFVN
jgi:membrane-bound metal-dependent hydrolase YbcI (DUF457 family)